MTDKNCQAEERSKAVFNSRAISGGFLKLILSQQGKSRQWVCLLNIHGQRAVYATFLRYRIKIYERLNEISPNRWIARLFCM